MDRRKFTKTTLLTGIAAGFPDIVPASVFGKSNKPAPSDRITMGFIGVGGKGTNNLRNFLEKSGARVLAVCDVDAKYRDRARDLVNAKYGNNDCTACNDFRELLVRKDIDAMCLSLPDQWHGIVSVLTAREGKDVYAEKPLAYTISEGRAIVEAVQQYNIVWQTGSQQRSSRNFRYACELVRNGRLGDVKKVIVGLPYGNRIRKGPTQPAPVPEGFDYDMWLGPAPYAPYCPARCHWNFRWISDYSGGQITDWAGHHCDIAQWGMNSEHTSPVEIEGEGVFPEGKDGLFDTAESYRFVCTYKQGFTLYVADSRRNPQGVRFEGRDGWVFVSRRGIKASPRSLLKSSIGPNDIHLYRSDDHHQNFLDCVKSRKTCVAPVEVGHRSIMIGHLGLISIKLGRKVYWDPAKERFVNDPEADRLLSRPMRSPWHL